MALFRRITFRGSGGINQGFGMNRFTLLYIKYVETSPVVQWLRLCASNAQYVVQGIKIPHVAPCGQKIKIHKQINKIYGIAQRTIFNILFLMFIYLFIFGCAGSALIQWLLSSCPARASHCGVFSRCAAQAGERTDFSSCVIWSVAAAPELQSTTQQS